MVGLFMLEWVILAWPSASLSEKILLEIPGLWTREAHVCDQHHKPANNNSITGSDSDKSKESNDLQTDHPDPEPNATHQSDSVCHQRHGLEDRVGVYLLC